MRNFQKKVTIQNISLFLKPDDELVQKKSSNYEIGLFKDELYLDKSD